MTLSKDNKINGKLITKNSSVKVKNLQDYGTTLEIIRLLKSKVPVIPNKMAYLSLDTKLKTKRLVALLQNNSENQSDAAKLLTKQASKAEPPIDSSIVSIQIKDEPTGEYYLMGLYWSDVESGERYLTLIPLFKLNSFMKVEPKN